MVAQIIRETRVIAIESGSVYVVPEGGTPTQATGGADVLDSNSKVFMSGLFGYIYFADGFNYKRFHGLTASVEDWEASAGTLPANGDQKPRLITEYNNRIVVASIPGDDHNWFASAAGDPTNFDYSATLSSTIAVAGNVNIGPGEFPDIINGIMNYRDDLMLFFGDESTYQMTGDPATTTSSFDLISSSVGAAFGRAFAMAPNGDVYFFGSRGGVYRLRPGGVPEKITETVIDELLADVDTGTNSVEMMWDDRAVGLRVWITPYTAATTNHYFLDVRNNAWYKDENASTNHDPIAVHLLDADDPDDRAILVGTRNGYILEVDHDADDDDGTAIDSHVVFGPFSADRLVILLDELEATLADGSGCVHFEVLAGDSAEEALSAFPATTGIWDEGRNYTNRDRVAGKAIYVKIRSQGMDSWALERIDAVLRSTSERFSREF